MSWKIQIEPVANGYILTELSDDKVQHVFVFQEDDYATTAVKPVSELLNSVLALLGATGSKHDAERVRVVIEKQNSFENDDNECGAV